MERSLNWGFLKQNLLLMPPRFQVEIYCFHKCNKSSSQCCCLCSYIIRNVIYFWHEEHVIQYSLITVLIFLWLISPFFILTKLIYRHLMKLRLHTKFFFYFQTFKLKKTRFPLVRIISIFIFALKHLLQVSYYQANNN